MDEVADDLASIRTYNQQRGPNTLAAMDPGLPPIAPGSLT